MCDIFGVASLTHQQRVQVQLPHRHGGMGLRHFSEDVAACAASRLSSAFLAHAVLAVGSDNGLPFRGEWGSRHTRLWRGFKSMA